MNANATTTLTKESFFVPHVVAFAAVVFIDLYISVNDLYLIHRKRTPDEDV